MKPPLVTRYSWAYLPLHRRTWCLVHLAIYDAALGECPQCRAARRIELENLRRDLLAWRHQQRLDRQPSTVVVVGFPDAAPEPVVASAVGSRLARIAGKFRR